MKRIKMFYGESNREMEVVINNWLEENYGLKICEFLQTFGNGGTYITIIYEE
jgi:hypothetical protein